MRVGSSGLGFTGSKGVQCGVGRLISSPDGFEVTAGSSALFPCDGLRRDLDNLLTDILLSARGRVTAGPVNAVERDEEIAQALSGFDFCTPRDMGDILRWVIARMEGGIVHVDHPRYFGLFNPTPTFPSQCADRIIAAFNPQLASGTTSPFPVALEAHVIRALAGRIGMPSDAAGHFTSGGSEANATAMVCALTQRDPSFARDGSRAFRGQPKVYVSQDAHLAWLKIAHQTGIGRNAVRLIPTTGAGCMDPEALTHIIASDAAEGRVPIMVVATAGTTGAGMIDPLADTARIARAHGAWYHVDAAWGGALVVSDRWRGVLAGIEMADSITIDAHKWLATTMGCGMFITSRPSALSAAFYVIMDCMPSNDAKLDPYVTTFQWSRRFSGLRLFLGLAVAGWSGYAEHVEHSILVANSLWERLRAQGWRRVNASPLGVLCLLPPDQDADVRGIVRAVVDGGTAWISVVEFAGRPVVRVCVTSGECNESDVTMLAEAMCAAARAVRRSGG